MSKRRQCKEAQKRRFLEENVESVKKFLDDAIVVKRCALKKDWDGLDGGVWCRGYHNLERLQHYTPLENLKGCGEELVSVLEHYRKRLNDLRSYEELQHIIKFVVGN